MLDQKQLLEMEQNQIVQIHNKNQRIIELLDHTKVLENEIARLTEEATARQAEYQEAIQLKVRTISELEEKLADKKEKK